jgi:hypothetical protein
VYLFTWWSALISPTQGEAYPVPNRDPVTPKKLAYRKEFSRRWRSSGRITGNPSVTGKPLPRKLNAPATRAEQQGQDAAQ